MITLLDRGNLIKRGYSGALRYILSYSVHQAPLYSLHVPVNRVILPSNSMMYQDIQEVVLPSVVRQSVYMSACMSVSISEVRSVGSPMQAVEQLAVRRIRTPCTFSDQAGKQASEQIHTNTYQLQYDHCFCVISENHCFCVISDVLEPSHNKQTSKHTLSPVKNHCFCVISENHCFCVISDTLESNHNKQTSKQASTKH